MKAIDRVMRAYLNTRRLTEDEASRVRTELAKFIDELMSRQTTQEPPASPDR